jgi:putative FmdB family regulatory protein
MPLYEYRCQSCGATATQLLRRYDSRPGPCEQCGSSELLRKLSAFRVHGQPSADPGAARDPGEWAKKPERFGSAMRALGEWANVKLNQKSIEGAMDRLRASAEE